MQPQHKPQTMLRLSKLSNLMVTRVYIPPNERSCFESDPRSPLINVVIGDFNSNSTIILIKSH